jgi:hypothetical protein
MRPLGAMVGPAISFHEISLGRIGANERTGAAGFSDLLSAIPGLTI